jgi:hypothetical protein
MVLAPLPHAFNMVRATEVIAVFGFVQPPVLARRFAGLAAWTLGTVVLMPQVTVVRMKECLTVLTLALSDVTSHWPASPQANDLDLAAWREENAEENAGRRRAKKTEEVDASHRWGRRRHGLHDNFTLTAG